MNIVNYIIQVGTLFVASPDELPLKLDCLENARGFWDLNYADHLAKVTGGTVLKRTITITTETP